MGLQREQEPSGAASVRLRTRKQGSEALQGEPRVGGPPLPGARTHFLLHGSPGGGSKGCGQRAGPAPSTLCTGRSVGPPGLGHPTGRMEDEEGPQCGKPDFVLLDQVTMEDFMENLKLRWALGPGPFSLVFSGWEETAYMVTDHSLGDHRGTWWGRQDGPLGARAAGHCWGGLSDPCLPCNQGLLAPPAWHPDQGHAPSHSWGPPEPWGPRGTRES